MKKYFAILGTGFWSRFQLAAWKEIENVECVALCDKIKEKALSLGKLFGIPPENIYDKPEILLKKEKIDFVDIITDPSSHASLTELCASFKKPVITQKPMSTDFKSALKMVKVCKKFGVPLFVHENWRWQKPIRKIKEIISSGKIGTPFRARVSYLTSFKVYENQPFLKITEKFIISDIGPHIFDTVRFLFGEVKTLFCKMKNVNPEIKGEDVASVIFEMKSGMIVYCEMSYFSRIEFDRFPQTFILVEGEKGTVELKPDYYISITTKEKIETIKVEIPFYPWMDPQYALVHASIVDCNRNILNGLLNIGKVETTGEDNLKSMKLVDMAYKSAFKKKVIKL